MYIDYYYCNLNVLIKFISLTTN